MRDINRIDSFLNEIGKLWREKVPDWRFGQLMFNYFSALGDPFFFEEDEFLEGLRAYLNREEPKEAIQKLREEKRAARKRENPVEGKEPEIDWVKFFEELDKKRQE